MEFLVSSFSPSQHEKSNTGASFRWAIVVKVLARTVVLAAKRDRTDFVVSYRNTSYKKRGFLFMGCAKERREVGGGNPRSVLRLVLAVC